MVVYQVLVEGGSYEDFYSSVLATFIDEKKAIKYKEELENKLEKENKLAVGCSYCQYYYDSQKPIMESNVNKIIKKMEKRCNFASLTAKKYSNSEQYYINCENKKYEDCDGKWYTIKEYQVMR